MTAPVPFPFALATIPETVVIPKTAILTAPGVTAITGDAAWTYAADNPGTYPAPGWFSGVAAANVANLDGFVLGSHAAVNQHYERLFTVALVPGLAPNKIVRVQGIIDWYRYTFAVAPVARVFVKANGLGLTNIPNTLTGGGSGPRAFNFDAVADGSGNLLIEFGIYLDNGVGSASIGATLLELEVISPGLDWRDVIYDSAVLYVDGDTPVSISRDSFRFEEQAVFDNYEYEGKVAPTYGGDEIVSIAPILTGKFMNVGEAQIARYQPGGAWNGSDFDRTYTPSALRTALSAGVYLSDVRCIWKLWTGGYLQVRFPKALCTSYSIGSQDKNEGEIPVVIEARQNVGSGNPKLISTYYIDRLPAGWTI